MIKGKRELLAKLLYHTNAIQSLKLLEPKSLVIFNYHRIRSDFENDYSFDEGVYGPTQSELRKQFTWLKENANVISEGDLLKHVRGEQKLQGSSVMITFDDGYRDNAELALPIIRDLKIPATFFISTRAIETRELGWWDIIAYLVKQTKHEQLKIRGRQFDLTPPREPVIRELQEWMRTLRADHTHSLIDDLSKACEVPLPSSESSSRELMSWEQIKEVAASGVTIGSHTHSHRVLSTLTLGEQFEEFKISKQILERELNQKIYSVAYPVGGHEDCHQETGELAEKCGYELGFSFQTGSNRMDSLAPFGIHRISAEDSIPLTCAAITLPTLFARSRSKFPPKKAMLTPIYGTENSTETS